MAPLFSGTPAIPEQPAWRPVGPTRPWLLTESQAAAVTGLRVKRLRKHRALGLPPEYVKIGRSVFYKTTSLRDYVASLSASRTGTPAVALRNGVKAEPGDSGQPQDGPKPRRTRAQP
jgi:hypothetical protein